MKKLVFALGIFMLFAFSSAYSQDSPVSSENAKDYIGKTVKVRGKVVSIFTSKNGNVFINFDEKSPNQTFTVAVFKESNIDVSLIKEGNYLTVSGEVKDYKGKPEIVLTDSSQIINIEQ